MASSLEEIPEMTPETEVGETVEASSVIGVVAESDPAENRVAATPATVAKLIGLGYRVVVERGAGTRAEFADAAYVESGAELVDGDRAWSADVVMKVAVPTEAEVGTGRRIGGIRELRAPAGAVLHHDPVSQADQLRHRLGRRRHPVLGRIGLGDHTDHRRPLGRLPDFGIRRHFGDLFKARGHKGFL